MKPEDAAVPLSRWRAALARARAAGGRGLAEALVADPTAPRWVPELPVQELYFALREVGLADASELLELASPEQVRGFVDLDAWSGAEFSPERAGEWLDALADLGPEKLARAVEALDPEVVGLFLQRQLRVYDLSVEQPPEEPEGHLYATPDTFYLLDVLPSGEAGKRIERLIDWLYRADPELGRRMVMLARWELPAEMEELAYRWRSGRMADLGYVELYEALEVYRFLDPASVQVGEGSADRVEPGEATTLPLALEGAAGESFLAQALATIADPEERARLHTALALLVNRVMAADRVGPADSTGARLALERTAAYLGLGLEFLGRGDPRRGGDALRTVAASRIFRVGVSLTLKLKQAADTLLARAFVTLVPGRASLLDEPMERAILALRARRPERAEGSGAARPFRTLAEVAEAAALLEEAALLGETVQRGLGVDPSRLAPENLAGVSPPRDQIRFRAVVATLFGNALFSRPPVLVPIPARELAELRQRALDPSAPDALRALADARLAERAFDPPPRWSRWLETWIAYLQATVMPSTVGAPGSDPSALTGILVR
jgi:hypothetical protein